jgi:hypothetical protein
VKTHSRSGILAVPEEWRQDLRVSQWIELRPPPARFKVMETQSESPPVAPAGLMDL